MSRLFFCDDCRRWTPLIDRSVTDAPVCSTCGRVLWEPTADEFDAAIRVLDWARSHCHREAGRAQLFRASGYLTQARRALEAHRMSHPAPTIRTENATHEPNRSRPSLSP